MTYTLKTSCGFWQIVPGPDGNCILKRKTKLRWRQVGMYESPEEAVMHLSRGSTGEADWDGQPHERMDVALAKWHTGAVGAGE